MRKPENHSAPAGPRAAMAPPVPSTSATPMPSAVPARSAAKASLRTVGGASRGSSRQQALGSRPRPPASPPRRGRRRTLRGPRSAHRRRSSPRGRSSTTLWTAASGCLAVDVRGARPARAQDRPGLIGDERDGLAGAAVDAEQQPASAPSLTAAGAPAGAPGGPLPSRRRAPPPRGSRSARGGWRAHGCRPVASPTRPPRRSATGTRASCR